MMHHIGIEVINHGSSYWENGIIVQILGDTLDFHGLFMGFNKIAWDLNGIEWRSTL